MSFLKRIQSKPRAVRTQYALGAASIVTGIIAVIWVSTLPARLGGISQPVENDTNMFSDFLSDTKSQLGTLITADTKEGSEETLPPPEHSESSALSNLSRGTSTVGTLDATSTPTSEAPKVILIATTSKEKSE